MKLVKVRVENYKSIDDSGWVPVEQITCLVGKNESGKTGILQALKKFNPIDNTKYDPGAEYPRKGYSKYKRIHNEDPANIVHAEFELTEQEIAEVESVFGKGVLESNRVFVNSNYNNEHKWDIKVNELVASRSDKSIGEYLEKFIPKFVYFDDYSFMTGEILIEELLERKELNELRGSDHTFLSLLEIAGLTLQELVDETNYDRIKSELEDAAISISDEVFEFWSQSKHLEVEFGISRVHSNDLAHSGPETILHVRIRDRKQRVSIPFDERSRGFVWFFSFICHFSRLSEQKEQFIFLLDEPALNLHAKAQKDFLRFIDERLSLKHQVIYSTHSPFMINPNKLDNVRTVQDSDERGTFISDDFNLNDKDTVFPLQAAWGYYLAQNLFVGPNCLLVKEPSDLIYLQILSNLLRSKGREGLDPKWVIVPVGGADKLLTYVSLLGQSNPGVVVLMDIPSKHKHIKELVKNGQNNSVIMFSEYTNTNDADMEDIFERPFYLDLVYNAYASKLNPIGEFDLPRTESGIVKQVEEYFKRHNIAGGDFSRYKPAAYFIKNQNSLMPEINGKTLDIFERLFLRINPLIDLNSEKGYF